MKTPSRLATLVACVLLLAALVSGPARAGKSPGGTVPPDPVVTSVKTSGAFVHVAAKVPPGIVRATLESHPANSDIGWKPRAVQRLSGRGGKVVFRVARATSSETFRVRGDTREELPATFYKGKRVFNSAPFNVGIAGGSADVKATGSMTPGITGAGTGATTATRTVVESDIWKIHGTTLYYFNQFRGLQILDLTHPDAASLKGALSLPAVGEQMYLLDDRHVVLLTRGDCSRSGQDQSQVLIVDVAGAAPVVTTTFYVPGWIDESRLVGTALYVASETWRDNGGTSEWGTQISSFDLANPTAPAARGSLWLSGNGNVITATDQFLFAAIHNPTNWWQSDVQVVDISSPDGSMQARGVVHPAGSVADKFKMNLAGNVFTVVSEDWHANGGTQLSTSLETFSLADPAAPAKLGELPFAAGERLFATRFDGNRAYVVTFQRVDPLWIVDLADPANPPLRGSVQVPGWSTYLQPLGNRLLTMGLDPSLGWRAAVSLFDVTDAAKPSLLSRVPLGDDYSWSEANSDEKAFGVFPDAGLVLVPYEGDAAGSFVSKVQLIDLGPDSLTARGAIQHGFTPRRAAVYGDRLVSISGSEFLSVNATDRDHPVVGGELALAWPVDRVFVAGGNLVELARGGDDRAGAALRVTGLTDPDRLVSLLTLTNWPVVGAEQQGDDLYVLQRNSAALSPPIYLGTTGGDPNTAPPQIQFTLSLIDLSQLPALAVRSQVTLTSTNDSFSSGFKALWPKPGLLVWANDSGPDFIFGWGGGVMPLVASAGAPSGTMAILQPSWRWWGDNVQLLAFGVSDPTAPTFASELTFADQDFRGDRGVFAANGLVYLSYARLDATTNAVLLPGITGAARRASSQAMWANPTLSGRTYLQVIDYTAPQAPLLRDPVNVPGLLAGVSRNGAMLYTRAQKWAKDLSGGDGTEQLQALAYDGVTAYFVDSLPLPNTWPNPLLISGETVFLGRAAGDGSTGTLEAWTLPDTGRFTFVSSLKLTTPASELAAFGDLLAVRTDDQLVLVGAAQPQSLTQVGAGNQRGCLGYGLDGAAGSVAQGLWIPLGDYGVWAVGPDAAP